jgi:hypothetical protein
VQAMGVARCKRSFTVKVCDRASFPVIRARNGGALIINLSRIYLLACHRQRLLTYLLLPDGTIMSYWFGAEPGYDNSDATAPPLCFSLGFIR